MDIDVLNNKAKSIRSDILKMLFESQSGHPGGSLSCVEILLTLYNEVANINPEDPLMDNRDRIVLSKGHACPALYAVLADKGFFSKNELSSLRKLHSSLQGHPDMKKTPGIDANTGSLGQGLSIAVGMALAAKLKKADYQVFAIIGDGETQEGITWEAAMCASHYKLDNLTVILDHNGLQIDGKNKDVLSICNIVDKYKSFGFSCLKIDGHDFDALKKAFATPFDGKPKFICCNTIKGKGVSFMENQVDWHGKVINKEQLEIALKDIQNGFTSYNKAPDKTNQPTPSEHTDNTEVLFTPASTMNMLKVNDKENNSLSTETTNPSSIIQSACQDQNQKTNHKKKKKHKNKKKYNNDINTTSPKSPSQNTENISNENSITSDKEVL